VNTPASAWAWSDPSSSVPPAPPHDTPIATCPDCGGDGSVVVITGSVMGPYGAHVESDAEYPCPRCKAEGTVWLDTLTPEERAEHDDWMSGYA
jgi:hypothetical protein